MQRDAAVLTPGRRLPALVRQVRHTLARHAMVVPGDRVLVAVSGGPDSVALLGALTMLAHRYGIELTAAHFNHRLRGAESDRDQACAAAVAAQLDVSCRIGTSARLAAGPNLEARARAERYAFLTTVAAEQHCTKIATGHTLDDQAETVLMRLLRGSGWDGLAAIRPVRDGHIIRPLLDCSRQQVLQFLAAHGLPFCEDSSNHDARFLRNRVRHEVMPLLRDINPAVQRHLATAASIVAAEGRVLDEHATTTLAGADAARGALAIALLREPGSGSPRPLARRLVRAWLRQMRGGVADLSTAHIEAIVALACATRPNACVPLPGGQTVVREYANLKFQADRNAAAPMVPRVLVPGMTLHLESGWRIRAVAVARHALVLPTDLWTAAADADVLAAPLLVRTARRGDRIQPLGMRGHRKLQDIFVDRKLPRATRHACPVIESGGKIVWIPGVARSRHALLTPATRSVVRLVAEKPDSQ